MTAKPAPNTAKPQKTDPKPEPPMEFDPEVLRMFADLDVDEKGRLKK